MAKRQPHCSDLLQLSDDDSLSHTPEWLIASVNVPAASGAYNSAMNRMIVVPDGLGMNNLGFEVMGTHMAHQFACQGTAACVMFVTFDRAYDIRWLKR